MKTNSLRSWAGTRPAPAICLLLAHLVFLEKLAYLVFLVHLVSWYSPKKRSEVTSLRGVAGLVDL
jgi:hypothetical protein